MRVVIGSIRNIHFDCRIISIRIKNRVEYFYLQGSLVKKFSKYLIRGRFVTFKVTDEHKTINKLKALKIDSFTKITMQRYREKVDYYNLDVVKMGIYKVMHTKRNKMFLDLELSMHPYTKSEKFVQEIIQIGIVIENNQGKVLEEYSTYVKPRLYPKITIRTKKFLKIDQGTINRGITAKIFYDQFKKLVDQYDPIIVIWGKNDVISLQDFYQINKFRNITPREKFLNLMQVYKNFYNFKNDVGLFKCFESFGNILDKQKHDALEDAKITRLVFEHFKVESSTILNVAN